jgi:hypothetical protein
MDWTKRVYMALAEAALVATEVKQVVGDMETSIHLDGAVKGWWICVKVKKPLPSGVLLDLMAFIHTRAEWEELRRELGEAGALDVPYEACK